MNDGQIRAFAPECYDSLAFCSDATCAFGRIDDSPFGTFFKPGVPPTALTPLPAIDAPPPSFHPFRCA